MGRGDDDDEEDQEEEEEEEEEEAGFIQNRTRVKREEVEIVRGSES